MILFRFETLQQSTVIHQQPLIAPLPLDLTSAEELVVADNIEIFKENGFILVVNMERPMGERVVLCAVPFSKDVQFGVSDVRELASMLLDDCDGSGESWSNLSLRHKDNPSASSNTQAPESERLNSVKKRRTIRLPKVTAMFASRACRSAVMIGTALTLPEMTGIVRNLATLDQPWNCPHGRPTLRHLVDLRKLFKDAQKSAPSQLDHTEIHA